MQIKIALPKGRLLRRTSALLQKAEWGLDEYHSKISFYHPKSQRFSNLIIKVFHEKDIPVQVAVGNYDLGICSLDWVEELLAKYQSSAIVKIKSLGYGRSTLCMVASISWAVLDRITGGEGVPSIEKIQDLCGITRIVSEYPNLAESFALENRLSRFSIFPVWGAAEVYPPENAELALIAVRSAEELDGMVALKKVLDSSAFLIANRNSLETRDLGDVVNSICDILPDIEKHSSLGDMSGLPVSSRQNVAGEAEAGIVRLALPDGHQQQPTIDMLNRAGIQVDDYPSEKGNRRPHINLEGVKVKVIRPQDMPLQVANGNFDLAITGRDWLGEHLCQFPSSPAKEILNLGFGKVRMVAVVSQNLPVGNVADLRQLIAEWEVPLRMASEYVQISDRYARENHLGPYRVIPTWGATEAFLPEDADLLIENTETGRTIARHNLKIIDTIFESTACLIGNKDMQDTAKKERINSIVKKLQVAAEEA